MKKLNPMEQEAKLKVLQECMDDMDGMMGEGLDAKKKLKAAPKKEAAAGGDHAMLGASEELEDEGEELSDEEIADEAESDELSEEELDAKIAELMAKKKSLKA